MDWPGLPAMVLSLEIFNEPRIFISSHQSDDDCTPGTRDTLTTKWPDLTIIYEST